MTTNENFAATAGVEKVFRIGELASEFDVTLRTLRFYENKGLLEPRRIGTTRLYSRRDRARLKLILMGKRLGFSLHDIRQVLELYDPADGNRRQLASAVRMGAGQLVKLRQERDRLDRAIGELEERLAEARLRLSALGS